MTSGGDASPSTTPLHGVRVLDFTIALAGPFGTMILTDLGAEVIKIEQPGLSEETRGTGPYVNGISTYRFSLDRGKSSIVLDLKTPDGLELALRLAEKSDVLAQNFTPGTLDRLGLGYEAVSARNPRIIYASLSGFGSTGPDSRRGALDVIIQALSGIMSITGEPDGPPMRVGASVGDTIGGAYLAVGVLTALYEREHSGRGQLLDVSMLESTLLHLENAIIRYSATGEVPGRVGSRHPLLTPFQSFQTADGWITVAGVRDWEAFCLLLNLPELARDPRFETGAQRTANHGVLEPHLQEAFLKRPSRQWLERLEDVCLAAPVQTIQEAVDHPQVTAREAVVSLPVAGPEEKRVQVPSSPVRLSRTPPRVDRPAPRLGEHTTPVLHDLLGLSLAEIQQLRREGVIDRMGQEGEPARPGARW